MVIDTLYLVMKFEEYGIFYRINDPVISTINGKKEKRAGVGELWVKRDEF